MTQAVENDTDIVWPDEEHLFAADNLSPDEHAVSPSSDGGIGGTDHRADQNTASFGEVAAESSDANEYWDHDDRVQENSNLRYHIICMFKPQAETSKYLAAAAHLHRESIP